MQRQTQQHLQSPFFETERQIGKVVEMISFALKTGTKRAFPVLVFDEISYQPETGISLFGRHVTVKITGRNLEALYQMLTLRRVREVREFCDETVSEEGGLWVDAIQVFSDYDIP